MKQKILQTSIENKPQRKTDQSVNAKKNDPCKLWVSLYSRSFPNCTTVQWHHTFSFCCRIADEMQREAALSTITHLQRWKSPLGGPQHQQHSFLSLRREDLCQRKCTAAHCNHRRNLHNIDKNSYVETIHSGSKVWGHAEKVLVFHYNIKKMSFNMKNKNTDSKSQVRNQK